MYPTSNVSMDGKAALHCTAEKISPQTKADIPQEPFRLLDLPAELRDLVYQHVIGDDITIISGAWRNAASGIPAICLVNRQLRSEILSLAYDSEVILVYLLQRHGFKEWIDKWQPGIAKYFRHIKLEDYQHFHYERPRSHRSRCLSSINIDLKQTENPVNYSRDLWCDECPTFEQGVTRVSAVVKMMEVVDGKWQLTKQSFIDMLKAAAWGMFEDDVVLGMEGNENFWLRS